MAYKPRGNNGGARPGAGAKPNSASVRQISTEQKRRLMASGKTPLEVLVEAMRDAYDEAGARAAAPYAEKAAPYLHPRLATVSATVDAKVDATIRTLPVETLTDDQLHAIAAEA